jgi:hypothetical protein
LNSIYLSYLNSDAHAGQVEFGGSERKSDIGKRSLRKSRTVERIRDAIEEDAGIVGDVSTADLYALAVDSHWNMASVDDSMEK